MDILPLVILFASFFVLMAIGLPISFAMGLATIATLITMFSLEQALFIFAQKVVVGYDSFTLLALPFFILAGNIMSTGGIARRLINLAKMAGRPFPGSLAHTNILANMLFGSVSGSAVASAAAVGGVMAPEMRRAGYDMRFGAAVNVVSCTTGLLIPPSGTFIIYSLISGGTSVAALFLAGYIPGILLGLTLMVVAGFIASRAGLRGEGLPSLREFGFAFADALLPLGLVVIIMGGIISGIVTATEAAGIGVIYALFLALVVYREMKVADLGKVILETSITTGIVMLLVGISSAMSWTMTFADMPWMIQQALETVSENPLMVLLFINLSLLLIGTFMDLTPALLIFTPIFLPVAQEMGMDPVHFGVMMTMNLCIGICTPPVGTALFVGASIAGVPVWSILRPILPFYGAFVVVLAVVTLIPELSLYLPRTILGYGG
ncbi:TRAP transporter large permease [Pararhodobacter sp.]|uniref:TRAP transporter large permease n=1 Tax=Pararhodobacter sp. TaxID=2127056 RepID=UPI002AFEA2DB|nr:TRAP transporter large permease [Pararhodobacter sp.]